MFYNDSSTLMFWKEHFVSWSVTKLLLVVHLYHIIANGVCVYVVSLERWHIEGGARPLFPQWSHHVYPQFLPASHPNAQHQPFLRHRNPLFKNYNNNHIINNNNNNININNNHVPTRYHRNSTLGHQGNWCNE